MVILSRHKSSHDACCQYDILLFHNTNNVYILFISQIFCGGPGFFLTHTTILFSESCHRYAQLLPIFCHRTSCDRESLLLQQFGECMPYGDTEFHSGEFGNELERFLYRYDLLKAKTESIERMLPQNQKDGFFEVVKYPIFLAALVAEKELEAQEARHIARPGLFNKDDEAKAAAAVSHMIRKKKTLHF